MTNSQVGWSWSRQLSTRPRRSQNWACRPARAYQEQQHQGERRERRERPKSRNTTTLVISHGPRVVTRQSQKAFTLRCTIAPPPLALLVVVCGGYRALVTNRLIKFLTWSCEEEKVAATIIHSKSIPYPIYSFFSANITHCFHTYITAASLCPPNKNCKSKISPAADKHSKNFHHDSSFHSTAAASFVFW